MIYVGTDLVEVDRIHGAIHRWQERFLRRIFTPGEIAYCQNQVRPSLHFAGRFAAKEAVKKALYSAGRTEHLPFREINVTRDGNGAPVITLAGLENQPRVSISHVGKYALATAVYEAQ